MFTPMFNSPFPAMNPRVRYKTALERAGFDVAYNGPGAGPRPDGIESPTQGRHASSEGPSRYGVQANRSFLSQGRRSASEQTAAVQQNTRIPVSRPQISPYTSSLEHLPQTAPNKTKNYESLSSAGRESSMFDFEKHTSPTAGMEPGRNQTVPTQEPMDLQASEPLNPVERSFMQLTRSSPTGSSLLLNSSGDSGEIRESMVSKNSTVSFTPSFQSSAKGTSFNQSGESSPIRKHVSDNLQLTPNRPHSDCSISFTPVAELNVDLSPLRERGPVLNERGSPGQSFKVVHDPPKPAPIVPSIRISTPRSSPSESENSENSDNSVQSGHNPSYTSFTSVSNTNRESDYSFQSSVLARDPKSVRINDEVDEKDENDISSVSNNSLQNTTIESSYQVEKLIAQLDDVSFNRNLSMRNNRSLGGNNNHIKKSSAYLSGFIPPQDSVSSGIETLLQGNTAEDLTLETQVLTLDEPSDHARDTNLSGDLSPTSVSTPQFYNFKKSMLPASLRDSADNDIDSMIKPSEYLTASLENSLVQPLLLNKKKSINDFQSQLSGQEISAAEPAKGGEKKPVPVDGTSKDSDDHLDQPAIFKYPPGEGPCRTCGLKVTTKRVYSKNDNELSGQWHRPCFKCIVCDLQFSKKVACYILDDEPYCQRHYHETNNSICRICKGFIEGECLENDRDERFHVHCLRCFHCQSFIREDYFLFNNELPLCANHDIEALKLEGLGGNGSVGRSNTLSKRRTRIINFT